jgi:hypothetical protein
MKSIKVDVKAHRIIEIVKKTMIAEGVECPNTSQAIHWLAARAGVKDAPECKGHELEESE